MTRMSKYCRQRHHQQRVSAPLLSPGGIPHALDESTVRLRLRGRLLELVQLQPGFAIDDIRIGSLISSKSYMFSSGTTRKKGTRVCVDFFHGPEASLIPNFLTKSSSMFNRASSDLDSRTPLAQNRKNTSGLYIRASTPGTKSSRSDLRKIYSRHTAPHNKIRPDSVTNPCPSCGIRSIRVFPRPKC